MDRLLSMEIFVAVVETGSFTAVADNFKLSPPMVSRHVQALENRMGASLITRTTRQHHLTEIGETYYRQCKDILQDIASAESRAIDLASHPKGKLLISAPVWYGMSTLAPAVAAYLDTYPDVDIELLLNDRFVDPVSEGFDALIRIGELTDSTMIARRLGDYQLFIAAAPAYIEQFGQPVSPAELARHHCLDFTSWRAQSGWRQINKHIDRQSRARLTSNNVQVLRQAALKGIGLIMMPLSLIGDDIQAGRLVEVLPDHKPPAKPVNLLFSQKSKTTAKIASFVDFLSDHFAA